MLATVLGMALSIQLSIASTFALGIGFYVVCTAMLVFWRPHPSHVETTVPRTAEGAARS